MFTSHSCKTFGGEKFGDELLRNHYKITKLLHNRFTINLFYFEPSGDQTLGPLKTRSTTQSLGELHFYIKLDVT